MYTIHRCLRSRIIYILYVDDYYDITMNNALEVNWFSGRPMNKHNATRLLLTLINGV